jgi:hypothetical protein
MSMTVNFVSLIYAAALGIAKRMRTQCTAKLPSAVARAIVLPLLSKASIVQT